MIRQIVTMALALCVGTLHTAAQQVTPFKAGDRVAFVGNSITDGGHYHSYIWLYYMTHFPNERMWMANCGLAVTNAPTFWRVLTTTCSSNARMCSHSRSA